GAGMRDGSMTILTGLEVTSLLSGMELKIVEAVRLAYETHDRAQSSLPHSSFLRVPGNEINRIIPLPPYFGGDFDVAGIKWVSSFPANLESGLDRASAAIILNCVRTGRPLAFIEGSIISAKRTAASAALAASVLASKDISSVAVLGCGLINF